MRVLIAAHYASEDLGGEGSIPLRLFHRLRARDVETWLVTTDAQAPELKERFKDTPDRLIMVSSRPGMAPVYRWGERLPSGPSDLVWTFTQLERLYALRPRIRQLVRSLGIDVVHQPIGVAPSIPSPLTTLGAPLVVGPLNGGMTMPPAFAHRDNSVERVIQQISKPVGRFAHHLVRGKLEADVLLIANERTRTLLPAAAAERSRLMPETAVVLSEWAAKDHSRQPAGSPIRFIYTGRLVALKGPDLLLDSFAQVTKKVDCRLDFVGDGLFRPQLEEQVKRLGIADLVTFHGWRSPSELSALLRSSDVYVLPSLRESGGVSILEAMATGLPSVVADWGGPADFIGPESGLRVSVSSNTSFVTELAEAMTQLGLDEELRVTMGQAARARVSESYDWDVLTDRLLDLYREAMS